MTLTDAGALYAIVNKKDQQSARCRAVLPRISSPLITTWPCFTEAMYFSYEAGGWRMQNALWDLVRKGTLRFHLPSEQEERRMQTLMERYKDTPMDLADASLVAAAETLGLSQVFTTDSDFYVYQISDRDAFEVIP